MGIKDWLERRKQKKEIERDIAARRGKAQIKQHISKQRQMSKKLRGFLRRAIELGDERQFRQLGKQYLWTLEDIKRWERYLLAFEAVEARRDQARSMAEFMRSIQAMSRSILASASPKALAETERDLQMAIVQAQNLEQVMDIMMEMTGETIFGFAEMSEEEMEEAFGELRREIAEEAEREAAAEAAPSSLDERIERGLRQIREEMKRSLKKG